MTKIDKILAALCFSERSKGVFDYAATLAMGLNADLVVANIINIRDVQALGTIESMGFRVDPEDYVRGVKEERREMLEKEILSVHFPREKLKIIFRLGHPYDELLKIIRDENIDMVVMGTKGRTNLEHVLLGSVAEKMFRHSPVPVVSYRMRKSIGRKVKH